MVFICPSVALKEHCVPGREGLAGAGAQLCFQPALRVAFNCAAARCFRAILRKAVYSSTLSGKHRFPEVPLVSKEWTNLLKYPGLISLPLPTAPQPSALLLPPINNLPAFASSDAYQKGQLSELAGHDSKVIPGSPATGQPRGTGLGISPSAARGGRRIG